MKATGFFFLARDWFVLCLSRLELLVALDVGVHQSGECH